MCWAARVDLSDYADLTDANDDAAAFNLAVADAGDGGVVYIPAGTVVLNSPIVVSNRSLAIRGDGVAVTKISVNFSNANPGLSFIATAGSGSECRWELRDFEFLPSKVKVAAALSVKDERGLAGNSRMKVRNVYFTSSTQNYFERGLRINGMADVDVEASNFVGELQDSAGEPPGRLTISHVDLYGLPSGAISLFLCHMRQVQHQFDIAADYGQLFLRQLNPVQCDALLNYPGTLPSGGWFYIIASEAQMDSSADVRGVGLTQITSSRFINNSSIPVIVVDSSPGSIVAGNFLHDTGIVYKQSGNAVVFGNHGYVSSGVVQVEDSTNFNLCNSLIGGYYYPAMYSILGASSNVTMVAKEIVQ